MLPAVCVPNATGTIPAATAAAEPLDDPPGVREVSWGLRVLPGVKYANSVDTVLPMISAPCCLSSDTRDASTSDSDERRYPPVPHAVGWSLVSMMSLMPTGTPNKGRSDSVGSSGGRFCGQRLPSPYLGLDTLNLRYALMPPVQSARRSSPVVLVKRGNALRCSRHPIFLSVSHSLRHGQSTRVIPTTTMTRANSVRSRSGDR